MDVEVYLQIFCLVPARDRLVKHHCVYFHAPCLLTNDVFTVVF